MLEELVRHPWGDVGNQKFWGYALVRRNAGFLVKLDDHEREDVFRRTGCQSEVAASSIHPPTTQSASPKLIWVFPIDFLLPETSPIQTDDRIWSHVSATEKFHFRHCYHFRGHIFHLLPPRRSICCSQIHFHTCITTRYP
jgi:hypothetical protein